MTLKAWREKYPDYAHLTDEEVLAEFEVDEGVEADLLLPTLLAIEALLGGLADRVVEVNAAQLGEIRAGLKAVESSVRAVEQAIKNAKTNVNVPAPVVHVEAPVVHVDAPAAPAASEGNMSKEAFLEAVTQLYFPVVRDINGFIAQVEVKAK